MTEPAAGLGAVDALSGVRGAQEPVDVEAAAPGGAAALDHLRLGHRALPGRDLEQVALATELLGKALAAPLLLAAGDLPTEAIRELARVASEHGVGLVLGGECDHTPTRPPLLLARLGAGELRAAGGLEAAERLVTRADADGLLVDLDELRAALLGTVITATERSALEAITELVERLAPLPVVAGGGGFGLDAADVRELRRAGVAGIDAGGATGEWGIPTADAVAEALLAAGPLPVIASGGLRDGAGAAKCLALGAAAAAIDWRGDAVAALVHGLRVAVWATGAASAAELSPGHLRST